jgi:hypothetical protein
MRSKSAALKLANKATKSPRRRSKMEASNSRFSKEHDMATTPRRRIIRPIIPPANSHPQLDRQSQKLRTRLEKERAALNRWMARLRRAFHSVEKIQRRVVRLEKQIVNLED